MRLKYLKLIDIIGKMMVEAGEMSALKWSNIDFDRGIIKVVETRVEGEEGRPKTQSSYHDIIMLPMVYEALKK